MRQGNLGSEIKPQCGEFEDERLRFEVDCLASCEEYDPIVLTLCWNINDSEGKDVVDSFASLGHFVWRKIICIVDKSVHLHTELRRQCEERALLLCITHFGRRKVDVLVKIIHLCRRVVMRRSFLIRVFESF